MHRAMPTKMRPSRRSWRSGRKAHAKPTMKRGAIIQFRTKEMAIWIQSAREFSKRWSVSKRTLQRIGYIITRSPMARVCQSCLLEVFDLDFPFHIPIGMLTPINSPLCNAGPTESTVLPKIIPIAMASTIHITRNRSRNDNPLSGGRSAYWSLFPIYLKVSSSTYASNGP